MWCETLVVPTKAGEEAMMSQGGDNYAREIWLPFTCRVPVLAFVR